MFRSILCFCLLSLGWASLAQSQPVKLSKSKICHDTSSPFYERVRRFTAFVSLDDCLKAGGRLPKLSGQVKSEQAQGKKYSRRAFGHGWADDDRDCQNTRHEVLIQQSSTKASLSKNGCKAVHGRWVSMFTGNVISDAKLLDIDHVVPLKWAWEHGAQSWPKATRIRFANDPVNLIAVERSLNRAKGAQGPDTWLPPSNACQYVLRFMRIVKRYKLQEPDSLTKVRSRC